MRSGGPLVVSFRRRLLSMVGNGMCVGNGRERGSQAKQAAGYVRKSSRGRGTNGPGYTSQVPCEERWRQARV